MKCPDLDRLIDFHFGQADPELEAHLQSCARCQSDMGLLYLLPAASAPQEEASEHLVTLAMEAILRKKPAPRSEPVRVRHRLGIGLLAALTVAFGLLLTGSPGGGGPLLFVMLSILSGVVGGVVGMPTGAAVKEAAI